MNGTQKNRYKKRAHISESKFKMILKGFAADITASHIAQIVGTSRNTINKYFWCFRKKILEQNSENAQLSGEIELDESYFGARRIRGKRGRGAAGKTPVFGILKRDGQVSVTIIPNCSKTSLMPIIQGKILAGSTVYTDGWKAYDGLILNGYDHYRIYHNHDEFARGKNHVNGIESFWSFAKRRLAKFNGLTDTNFYIHLKETEFRFNNRHDNLYLVLLRILKLNPL